MIVGCGSSKPHSEHGDCPGWAGEGVIPTAEETLGRLRSGADTDERALDFLRGLFDASDTAHRCFMENHVARVEDVSGLAVRLGQISNWIDGSYPADLDPEAHTWRRVTKVVEEVGEMWAKLAGMLGENPRKGVTNDVDEVVEELLDCAGSSLGAVYYLRDGTDVVMELARRIEFVHDRAGLADGDRTPEQRVQAAEAALHEEQRKTADVMKVRARKIAAAQERLAEAHQALGETYGDEEQS